MKKAVLFISVTLFIAMLTVTALSEGVIPYSANLNGHGFSDVGREEPQYVGTRGYLVYCGTFSDSNNNWQKRPWYIQTYKKDKQFWIEDGMIEHKTEVNVLWQQLEHEGYGAYSGILQVEKLDTHEHVYVNVHNYITEPY